MSESHVESTGLGGSFAALLKMFLQSPTVFVSSSFKLHPEKHHECERKTRFLLLFTHTFFGEGTSTFSSNNRITKENDLGVHIGV